MALDNEDIYIRKVIAAYKAEPSRMGDFPMGDFDTVRAAEILKRHSVQGQRSFAVEVAKVTRGIKVTYVFGNSGAPDGFVVNLATADAELKRLVGGHAAFHQVTSAFDFYEPSHRDLLKAIQSARADFDGKANLVRLSDVAAAAAGFLTAFRDTGGDAPDFVTMHRGQQQHYAKTSKAGSAAFKASAPGEAPPPQQALLNRASHLKAIQKTPAGNAANAAVEALFAAAAAFRVRMTVAAEHAAIGSELEKLRGVMLQNAVRPWMPQFAAQLRGLIGARGTDPVVPGLQVTLNNGGFQNLITKIYRLLGQSRFCAEPRVFAALSKGEVAGNLAAQTCYWHQGTDMTPNPGEYGVVGPKTDPGNSTLGGSYMWPCTSCRQRSGGMLGGIAQVTTAARPHEV